MLKNKRKICMYIFKGGGGLFRFINTSIEERLLFSLKKDNSWGLIQEISCFIQCIRLHTDPPHPIEFQFATWYQVLP